ncbi:MAG: oligosaccharide flippase family protein [Planctomycetes bacterium]|nr:oligosaccharide flippase family protein [Planctomycetota bacterium]
MADAPAPRAGLVARVARSNLFRGTALLWTGMLFSKGVAFLLLMWLARLYDKEEMARLQMCLFIIVLAGEAADLGVSAAYIRFAGAADAGAPPGPGGVARFALLLKLAFGLLVLLPAALLAPEIAARFFPGVAATAPVLASLVAGLAVNLASLAGAIFLTWRMIPRDTAINAGASLVRAALVVAVVLAGAGRAWQPLVYAMAVAPVLALGAAALFLPRGAFRGAPMPKARRREFLAFASRQGPADALGLLAQRAPLFILADSAEAADFSTAVSLSLPLLLFTAAFRNAMAGRVSATAADADVVALARRAMPYLLLVTAGIGAAFLAADPLMALAWSEKYRTAGPALRGLLAALTVLVLDVPLLLLLYYRKRSSLYLAMNLFWVAASGALAFAWGNTHGAAGAAWALAAGLAASRLLGLALLPVFGRPRA